MTDKTPQTPDSTTLLREIDETLHYDRLRNFWAEYKYVVIATIAAIFIGSMGMQGYQKLEAFNAEKQANNFWQAWSVKNAEQISEFDNNSSDGYRLLSLFEQAKATEDKQAFFADVKTNGLPGDWQDLMTFYDAQTALSQARYEDASKGFAKLKKSWLAPLAYEGLGQAAFFMGKKADAGVFYETALETRDLPAALKRRLLARLSALEMEVQS
jgi:hypothetical protein